MSAVFETFIAEVRALVVATWPDTSPDGVWENEDMEMVPWDKVNPPIANMQIPEMPIDNTGMWGACNEMHTGTITIYFVGATTGDSSLQRTRAESMRDALLTAVFTAANVLDVGSVNWSSALPINGVFTAKGYDFRAVAISANVIVAAKVAT